MLEYYQDFTGVGQAELDEFIDLVKEKMEIEFTRAEALDKLSQFALSHLKGSIFEEAAQGIIRKADNEAF